MAAMAQQPPSRSAQVHLSGPGNSARRPVEHSDDHGNLWHFGSRLGGAGWFGRGGSLLSRDQGAGILMKRLLGSLGLLCFFVWFHNAAISPSASLINCC